MRAGYVASALMANGVLFMQGCGGWSGTGNTGTHELGCHCNTKTACKQWREETGLECFRLLAFNETECKEIDCTWRGPGWEDNCHCDEFACKQGSCTECQEFFWMEYEKAGGHCMGDEDVQEAEKCKELNCEWGRYP